MTNMSESTDLSESAKVAEDFFTECVNEIKFEEAVVPNQNLPEEFVNECENETKSGDTDSSEEDTDSSEEEDLFVEPGTKTKFKEVNQKVPKPENETKLEEDSKSNEEEDNLVDEPVNKTKFEQAMETNEEVYRELPEDFVSESETENETKSSEDMESNDEEDFDVEPVTETNEEVSEEVPEVLVDKPEYKTVLEESVEPNQEVVQKLPENVGEPEIEKEIEEPQSTNEDVDESEDCATESEAGNDTVDENVVGAFVQEPETKPNEMATDEKEEKRGRKHKIIEIINKDNSNSEVSKKSKPENVPTPVAKKQKLEVDLTDPQFLKPLELGWKRELVYRNTNERSKRNCDIYYYTPAGKKLRSMREVAEKLNDDGDVTIENFTFFKKPLGLDDPAKEIVRNANSKPGVPKKNTPKLAKRTSPKNTSPKKMSPKKPSPKKTSPKNTSPKKSPVATAEMILTTTPLQLNKLSKSIQEVPKHKTEEKIGTTLSPFTPKLPKLNEKSRERKRKITFPESDTKFSQPRKITRIETDNFFESVAASYKVFLNVFKYLNIEDLLNAACVSKLWNFMANNQALWQTVRMKNSHLQCCKGMVNMLKKNGTVHLDLRKTILYNNGSGDFWNEFATKIKKVKTLRKIQLCRCPAEVVEKLCLSNQKLEVINAVMINSECMDTRNLANLQNLQELYLKAMSSFRLSSDLNALTALQQLKHLSLTSIGNLNQLDLSVIGNLTNLKSLSLGECVDLPSSFPTEVLNKLISLEQLRLEKGQGNCYTLEILAEIKNLQHLNQLELINFDLKTGFDHALGACKNIKKLLLIPNYTAESSLTTYVILGGVMRIQSTLRHFVWGITTELIKITEFLRNAYGNEEEGKLNNLENSIPVLKPIPNLENLMENLSTQDQVQIMTLSELQMLLLKNMPSTRTKLLKIPFKLTWKQSLQEW